MLLQLDSMPRLTLAQCLVAVYLRRSAGACFSELGWRYFSLGWCCFSLGWCCFSELGWRCFSLGWCLLL
jgi:hypothetical protein